MIFAQIKSGVVKNTIVLQTEEMAEHFLEGFDSIVRIDELSTKPGIGWTFNGSAFAPPASSPSPSIQVIVANAITSAQQFGNGLMVQFATENVLMGMTQDQMDEILSNLAEVMSALTSGSLKIAIIRINRLDPNDPLLPASRIQQYRNQIEDYLGIPRT